MGGQDSSLDLHASLFLWLEGLTVTKHKKSYLTAYSSRICYKNMKLYKYSTWENRKNVLELEL